MRARLVQIEGGPALLALCGHVIVSDGWSKRIFLTDVAAAYRALGAAPHRRDPFEAAPLPFRTFARWEREAAPTLLDLHAAYWRARLGNLEPPALPYDGSLADTEGATCTITLSSQTAAGIARVARTAHVSRTAVNLAAFFVALRAWSGQSDLTVQFPVPHRDAPEFEGVVGCFTETALLRERVVASESFIELARRVGAYLVEALDRAVPFEALVQSLFPSLDRYDPASFPVMFSPQPDVSGEFEIPGVSAEDVTIDIGHSLWPLHVNVFERDLRTYVVFRYRRSAFREVTIECLARLFESVIAHAVEDVQLRADDLGRTAVGAAP